MNQQHVSFRIPPDLLERVEQYRHQLEASTKQRQTRADALRSLIAHGLDATRK